MDLNDLYYFVQVVDAGGFAAASRAIGVPKSKLSRRITALEEHLNTRLLHRSSRRFSVTEIGRLFYERCVAMLVEAEAAEHLIAESSAAPRGIIRITCPTALISFQFGALFARFMARYPEVELHLESTNRRVDVIAEGIDIAIRVRFPPLAPSELVMRKLDESSQCLVASPALISAPLSSVTALNDYPSVSTGPAHSDHFWDLTGPKGATARISHKPRLVTDDMSALRDAALNGIGITQLPTLMIANDIQQGRLIHLLPAWRPKAGIVHAVFSSRRGLLPSVRVLLDFLTEGCAEQRRQATNPPPTPPIELYESDQL